MEVRDLALGQSDDAHASKAHALVEPGNVLLVAGQAVQGFGENDIEFGGGSVGAKVLDAGTE